MLKYIQDIVTGSAERFELEHRCYNGVCLAAGLGCLAASILSVAIGMGLPATLSTCIIGSIYLWLYFKGRRSETYRPIIWLYIFNGATLLVLTWFYNGGLDGSEMVVSMVALVAMTVVLKSKRFVVVSTVYLPIMSFLFLIGYLYPESVTDYSSVSQRYIDVYLSCRVYDVMCVCDLMCRVHDLMRGNDSMSCL